MYLFDAFIFNGKYIPWGIWICFDISHYKIVHIVSFSTFLTDFPSKETFLAHQQILFYIKPLRKIQPNYTQLFQRYVIDFPPKATSWLIGKFLPLTLPNYADVTEPSKATRNCQLQEESRRCEGTVTYYLHGRVSMIDLPQNGYGTGKKGCIERAPQWEALQTCSIRVIHEWVSTESGPDPERIVRR